MGEILVANATGILVLVVSVLFRIEDKRVMHLSDRLFNAMIAITFGALVAETLAFALDGLPGVHLLLVVLNAYLFLASSGVGALWVLYVDYRIYHSRTRLRRLMLPIIALFAVVGILVVCDLFGAGLLFSVSQTNVYQRGDLILLPCLVLLIDYSLSLAQAVVAVKQNRHVRFFPVHYYVVPCLIGSLVQGLCYGMAVGWLCVSLALQFVQMQLSNQNAFVDDLSGLYNRKYYNRIIGSLADPRQFRSIAGIMMDVDAFKSINDQFGHLVGDDAIRSIGRILSSISSERTIAFRHAGDEFLLLRTDGDEQDIQHLIEAISQKLDHFNTSAEKPYRLSLSMGYAVYDTAQFDAERFLQQMDVNVYKAKDALHAAQLAAHTDGHAI